jgi:DNA-binding NtrC family response regulator
MVIDDEMVVREGLRRILAAANYEVDVCGSGHRALEQLLDGDFSLVITDLKMPGMSGMEVLREMHSLRPDIPVIMITGYAMVDTAVEAMKHGAIDYIAKPFTPQEIIEKVQEALKKGSCSLDEPYLRKELHDGHGFGQFVGESKEMQKVYRRIMQVAPTDSTVMVTGESGTGKELVARSIHANSLRREGPFVTIDCTSLVENLLESELFGHVKGSFTGAMQTKEGLFKVADGGTLFLDEMANISLAIQAKLLRVLQQREITPIGSTKPVPVDIRLVAASNLDLKEQVQRGAFREDLFFRLNIIPIDLPPLRERRDDIPLLVQHFLRKYAEKRDKEVRSLTPDALAMLKEYHYPGNVRELENIIERSVVLAYGDAITKDNLELFEANVDCGHNSDVPSSLDELKEAKRLIREQAIEPIERAFVINALERNRWNVTRAAEDVGMQRPNLQALLKKYGISSRGVLAE